MTATTIRIEDVYTPNPTQLRIHQSSARVKLVWGPVRTGKSDGAIVDTLLWCLRNPGGKVCAARYTYDDVKEYVVRPMLAWAEKFGIVKEYVTRKEPKKGSRWKSPDPDEFGHDYLLIATGGLPAKIDFRNLEDEFKFRGAEYGRFHIDDLYNDRGTITEALFNFLISRCCQPGVEASAIITTNPTPITHWAYAKFFGTDDQPVPDGYELIRTAPFENQVHLPPDYFENLLKDNSPSWCRVYVYGEPGVVQSAASCISDFEETLQVKPSPPVRGPRLIRSWDFGYRYMYVLFGQMVSVTGGQQIQWQREKMMQGYTIDRAAQEVKAFTAEHYPWDPTVQDCGDPAGHQHDPKHPLTLIEILRRDHGIQVFTSKYSGKGEIEAELSLLNRLCRDRVGPLSKLQIDPSCTALINAFGGGYHRDAKGVPKKDQYYDHPPDAARYWGRFAYWGHGSRPAAAHAPVPSYAMPGYRAAS